MNNKGFAPIYFIIAAGIILLGGGGYFGYQTFNKPQEDVVRREDIENLKKEFEAKIDEEQKKYNQEIQNKNTEISRVNSQNQTLLNENKNLTTQISTLKKDVSSKDKEIDKIDSKLSKQESCNKMNEYSQLSSDLKFRYGGAGEGDDSWRRCTSTVSPQVGSNTENAYEYVSGWYENYKNTGNIYYKHNPDLCLDDVEKLLSKLKERRDKYREYKSKCEK